jgi:hypothetical protein
MVTVVITRCTTFPNWLLNDMTPRIVVAKYGSIYGLDPIFIREGERITH